MLTLGLCALGIEIAAVDYPPGPQRARRDPVRLTRARVFITWTAAGAAAGPGKGTKLDGVAEGAGLALAVVLPGLLRAAVTLVDVSGGDGRRGA
eukprot:SAG31_NODE_33053_length_348_cov_1.028112_1_plen_93_part_10